MYTVGGPKSLGAVTMTKKALNIKRIFGPFFEISGHFGCFLLLLFVSWNMKSNFVYTVYAINTLPYSPLLNTKISIYGIDLVYVCHCRKQKLHNTEFHSEQATVNGSKQGFTKHKCAIKGGLQRTDRHTPPCFTDNLTSWLETLCNSAAPLFHPFCRQIDH